jgi:K+-sensing histidine kinase KdpD
LGPAWQSGSEEEQRRRREKRFSIKGKSAGAYVYRNKRTKVITDVSAEEFYSETFPETRQLIVSPIMHGRNVLGVLDIRKTDTIPFQPQSELAVDLLARQLALYHQLVENVRRISGSEERLKQSAEEQRSRSAIQAATYQNLEHQFKTPILKARRQMEQYLNRVGNSHVAEELQAVRSHLAQAYLIAYNTRLFADLAGDKPLNLSLKNMLAGSFVGLIREAGTENELVYAHTNQVKFRVHEDTFINNISGLTIDRSLFQHALWNVLDNAGKYSKSRTTVTISCGFTRRDRYFYISIQNTSRVPIRPEETARAVEREWQSPKVVSGDGPGSGIGLWIANNIMQAHGGEVAVSPTNHLDLTDVRLLISGSLVTKRG